MAKVIPAGEPRKRIRRIVKECFVMLLTFLILIFAHLLADYPLQGEFLATTKGVNPISLISHAGIWSGCIAVAGFLIGFDIGLFDVVLLFIIHAIADSLKAAYTLWSKK